MAQVCPRCSTTWAPSDDFLGGCPKCLLGWAADAPVDPARVGAYEIVGRLGAGGMGVVYRARQPELGREVALKLLAPGEDDDRFLREAKSAARLSHPGIVPVFEVGRHDGRPFYAMELVEGSTLASRIRAGRLAPREAASIVGQAARALAHAHRSGILHRDVKPSNILLGSDGRARLADFGIARDLSRDTRATSSGSILGTPAYMAPEQVEGEAAPSADIYALGATLYECLTGAPPFPGPTPARVLHRVLHDEPRPPRRLRPELPRDLDVVCLKALRKKPGERYASAEEMAEDLERFLRGDPILARPVPPLIRAGRAAVRHRFAVAVAAVIALALGIALRTRPPDESGARDLLSRARELTSPDAATRRQEILREARTEARSPELARQIDDLLGRADASPWFFLLLAGVLPPDALDAVAPEARPHLARAFGGSAEPLREIELALAYDPNSWRAWLAACAARLRDGDPAGAREAARRARTLAPDLRAAAAFEAIVLRAGWHFGGVEVDDPLAGEDAGDPVVALAKAIAGHVQIDRHGRARIAVETYNGASLEDVPPLFLPVRAWLRLMAEDVDGARRDLASSTVPPGASKEWLALVDAIGAGLERPVPWLLLAQARSRLAAGLDPEPKVAALLELAGNDPLHEALYRRPALAIREAAPKQRDALK